MGKKLKISVTEAARNFADCINRVHYQNTTYVLLKNGSPVAQLIPGAKKPCSGRDLAEAISKTELGETEAAAWHRQLQLARKRLKAPVSKWR